MEDCKRQSSDRRDNDRRISNIEVEYNNRTAQRRSGVDRREILSGQV